MQTKPKTIFAVALIFIVTIGVVAVTVKMKKQPSQIGQASEQQRVQPGGQSENSQTPTEDKKPETFSTVFMEGEAVSFKDNQLEIKNGEIDNIISVIEKPMIYKKVNAKIQKKEISELKKGTKIKAEIDMKNSMVISVEIL